MAGEVPPCVACLHVPKIQYMTGKIDDDKEETCSLPVRLNKQTELLKQVWTSAPTLCPFNTQRDFSLLHRRGKLWSVLTAFFVKHGCTFFFSTNIQICIY